MFHDDKFKLKYSVDKRGKPVELTTNDNLKKFYELSESEAEDENEKKDDLIDPKIGKDLKEETSSDNESDEEKENVAETGDTSDENDTSDEEDDEDTEEEEEAEGIPWNGL